MKKLKYIVDIQKGKVPKKMTLTDTGNLPIYLAMDYLRDEPKHISFVPGYEKYVLVDKNEILLLWDGSNAGEFMWSKKGVLSSTMAVIKLKTDIHKSFLFYQFKKLERYLKDITVGMGIPHVNPQEFLNYSFLIPSFQKQTAIANHLDRKTAEIDKLITQKESLLKLYEEEKTAIIDQAVTKGINPDVKLKDSGIDWLGDTSTSLSAGIPEHWEVKKLKYVVKLITEKSNGELKKVALENIESKSGIFLETNSEFEGVGIKFKIDDILYGKLRPYLAKVLLANFEGSAVGDFFVLRPKENYFSEFIKYRLLSSSFTEISNSSTYGSKMPRVSWEFMSHLFFALPNKTEQTAIVHHIEIETSRINTKSEKTKKLIELLKEYKTALISEVVTGKVKVLNYDYE